MAKYNKYAKVEGLLYSYSTLPYRKKNIEIDLQLTDDPNRRDKLEKELSKLELLTIKIQNILDMLKESSEREYLIIKLRYIDKLQWKEIETQLNMTTKNLIHIRNEVINKKLIALVD